MTTLFSAYWKSCFNWRINLNSPGSCIYTSGIVFCCQGYHEISMVIKIIICETMDNLKLVGREGVTSVTEIPVIQICTCWSTVKGYIRGRTLVVLHEVKLSFDIGMNDDIDEEGIIAYMIVSCCNQFYPVGFICKTKVRKDYRRMHRTWCGAVIKVPYIITCTICIIREINHQRVAALHLACSKISNDIRLYGHRPFHFTCASGIILCQQADFILLLIDEIRIIENVSKRIFIKCYGVVSVSEIPVEYGGVDRVIFHDNFKRIAIECFG